MDQVRPNRADAIKNEISARSSKNTNVIRAHQIIFRTQPQPHGAHAGILLRDGIDSLSPSLSRFVLFILLLNYTLTVCAATLPHTRSYPVPRRRTRIISADDFFLWLCCVRACLYLFYVFFVHAVSAAKEWIPGAVHCPNYIPEIRMCWCYVYTF